MPPPLRSTDVDPSGALPELVRGHLARAVPEGTPPPRRVRIVQSGQMRLAPKAGWKAFTATQDFEAERSFFEWRARMPLAGPVAMNVVDGVESGRGELEGTLLGLRVVRARGSDVDLGELMRYLAEIPWNPGAIALHPGLRWQDRGDRVVDLRCTEEGLDAELRFRFDQDGDVTSVLGSRPRKEGKRVVPTPWGGRFDRYQRLGGIRVPTWAEVWWELPEGRYTYFRGRVTDLEVR